MLKLNNFIKLKYIYENFDFKSIPEEIKELSKIIKNDISKQIFKKYDLGDGIEIEIILKYSQNSKPYYSNINIFNILNQDKNIPIIINVEKNYDLNYLMGIISHELRHIYDIFTISNDIEMIEFQKSLYIKTLKNKNKDFLDLVYLSLEHELIAYNNMLYETYRWLNITDKSKLLNLIKESYTYKSLYKLKNFNHMSFIKKYNNLETFVLEFSDLFGDKYNGNVSDYFKQWELFFKDKAKTYLKQIDIMIDEVINDINNDKTNELVDNSRYELNTEIFKTNYCYHLFKKLIDYKNKL